MELLVKRITEHAFCPIRMTDGAAGYDLRSAYPYVVPTGGKCLCLTDLQLGIPSGHYGRLAPRSGLAKSMIDVGAGVIDSDYRGNVGVLLYNFGTNDFNIKKGDRIAQLILEKISTPVIKEVEFIETTSRGEGGFGSTGI